jgi:hypothetical protein
MFQINSGLINYNKVDNLVTSSADELGKMNNSKSPASMA